MATEWRSRRVLRLRRHLLLLGISAGLVAIVFAVVQSDHTFQRVSMATAYASLTLLVVGLALGPANVLRGRPNPVSTHLRRDIGIWAAGLGLLHVIAGLQVHMRGRMLEYFVDPRKIGSPLPIRLDAFGAANYAGVLAGLILIVLLSLSNDFTLRQLGARRWKAFQRANYFGTALIVGHGVVYQLLEKRQPYFVVAFALLVVAALTLQLAAYRKLSRGKRRPPPDYRVRER